MDYDNVTCTVYSHFSTLIVNHVHIAHSSINIMIQNVNMHTMYDFKSHCNFKFLLSLIKLLH